MIKKIAALLLLLSTTLYYSCADFKMVTISKVESAKIIKLDKSGIELQITVRINNPNSAGFNIYKSHLQASINDLDIGELKVNKKIRIKRKSNDAHTFTVSADFSKVSLMDLPKLLSLGQGKGFTLGLKGKLKVGKVFYKKTFEINRKEKISL